LVTNSVFMEMNSITDSTHGIYQFTYNRLIQWGIPDAQANLINLFVLLVLLLAVLGVVDFVVRRVLIDLLTKAARKSPLKFDDLLVRNKALVHMARLIPLMVSIHFVPVVF